MSKIRKTSKSDKSSSDSSSSLSSSCEDDVKVRDKLKKIKKKIKKEERKAEKRLKKKLKREKKKLKKAKKSKEKERSRSAVPEYSKEPVKEKTSNVPIGLMERSKAMAPMTKEEWEKRQAVVRKVLDEESGRYRLIKGDGEVLEEIVPQKRHKEINKQATQADGAFYQSVLSKGTQ